MNKRGLLIFAALVAAFSVAHASPPAQPEPHDTYAPLNPLENEWHSDTQTPKTKIATFTGRVNSSQMAPPVAVTANASTICLDQSNPNYPSTVSYFIVVFPTNANVVRTNANGDDDPNGKCITVLPFDGAHGPYEAFYQAVDSATNQRGIARVVFNP
jgi:hypothetical protein